MAREMKRYALVAAWSAGGALLVAILVAAVLLVLYGDAGLGFVLAGLGLIQTLVMVVVARRPRATDRARHSGLSAAE